MLPVKNLQIILKPILAMEVKITIVPYDVS
jgi:hypothetical protein